MSYNPDLCCGWSKRVDSHFDTNASRFPYIPPFSLTTHFPCSDTISKSHTLRSNSYYNIDSYKTDKIIQNVGSTFRASISSEEGNRVIASNVQLR
jgi:hypothetical protein